MPHDPPGQGSSEYAAPASAPPSHPHRIRIEFIDSLRAIAAVYVVLVHAMRNLLPYEDALIASHPRGGKITTFLCVAFLRHGHLAVAVFIVISGYCLMLPLARKGNVRMEGIWPFILRRGRRILPPYYAALVFSLLLTAAWPAITYVLTGEWAAALPSFGPGTLISHLFLYQHWSNHWIMKIDPPMWSIGVEWQIYFLMPFLFLPMLRWFGRGIMLILSALLGIVLTYAGEGILPTSQGYIHFVALFAAGMVAAQICFAPDGKSVRLRNLPFWDKLFFALFVLIVTMLAAETRKSWDVIPWIHVVDLALGATWFLDYLVAACFVCLLIALCQDAPAPGIRGIFRALHWAPLVFVGHFSYSIYLIHDPFLRLVCTAGEILHVSALSQYFAAFLLGVPLAIFGGYLLYLGVERHFISAVPVHSK
jgi:peptidoglycan/LPS O-acetylase OafA/YrhL